MTDFSGSWGIILVVLLGEIPSIVASFCVGDIVVGDDREEGCSFGEAPIFVVLLGEIPSIVAGFCVGDIVDGGD